MHQNRLPRPRRQNDPAAAEHERADRNAHAQRMRLLAQLDRYTALVAQLAAEAQANPHWPAAGLTKARERLAFFAAAAERAGLTRKEAA